MYFLLGISLMLALLLVLNLLVSTAATVLWRVLAPTAKTWTAHSQAQTIFALRIFPFAATLVFLVAFLLPAYFLFEPHSSEETVGVKLALLAFVSVIGVGIAAWRVFGTWRRTRRLVKNWLVHAKPILIADVKIPVYQISHPFPVIAVVGAFRPRMFVASQIFAALDRKEFRAAIRHEDGHLTARDNLKRTLMRVCSDSIVFPFGGKLDRAWAENVECAADEYAARNGGASAALNLASALLKIARIVPPDANPAMPAGAFLIEPQTADITGRVRYLLRLSETKISPANYHRRKLGNAFLFFTGVFFALTLMIAANNVVLHKVYIALESVVSVLQ
jgi:Zn-dependent protease with chaperone function